MSMERDAILSLFSRSDTPTVFSANHMTKTLVLRRASKEYSQGTDSLEQESETNLGGDASHGDCGYGCVRADNIPVFPVTSEPSQDKAWDFVCLPFPTVKNFRL
jgi:hypothetical protein